MLRGCGRVLATLFVIALVIGCDGGASAGRVAVHKVTGKVTLSGAPLAGATVAFVSSEKKPAAIGRTNDQGEYTLTTYVAGDGAAAGKFAVVITKSADAAATPVDPAKAHGVGYVSGAHDAAAAAAANKSSNLVPDVYGSATKTPLSATVTASGPNQFPFDLK